MANGRDKNGRFTKGNQEWRKRERHGMCDLADLRSVIDANVKPEQVAAAWQRLGYVLETGGPGWLRFFEFYCDRRYGKPAQYTEADITSDGMPLLISWNDGDHS